MFSRRFPLIIAPVLLVLACGGGGVTPTTAPVASTTLTVATTLAPTTTLAPAFPVTVGAANGSITFEQQPVAIVSLSPTATEMLYAIGAGNQVIAVDDQSDYPEGVPTTDLSGFTPNIEAIAAYQPDLVVVSNDIDGMVGALTTLEIPVLLLPAATAFFDVYAQIEQLGMATGHLPEAVALNTKMQADIEEIKSSLPVAAEPLTYYHELDPTYFSVTSTTFIGQVYALLGLENIADRADTDGSGYPQLTSEFIVSADPDLIFLADTECCEQNATTVAERPGWSGLSAVTGGGVVELSDDVASRWGPRIVDFLRAAAGGAITVQAAA